LAYCYPEISKEWAKEKNAGLDANDVLPKSGKLYWWLCPICDEHYKQTCDKRTTRGMACPCTRSRSTRKHNLEVSHPNIAKEWHPSLNGNTIPSKYVPTSDSIKWWKCSYCNNDWKMPIMVRTISQKGCPKCYLGENNLEKKSPMISIEWNSDKNGMLPSEVLISCGDRFWWKCVYNHEWKTSIYKRYKEGQNCPKCSNQSSKPELRLYAELKYLFGNVLHREKIDKYEIDIYIKDLKIGIEYDGAYWHRNTEKKDSLKYKKLTSLGIVLYRIRENPLPKIYNTDILVQSENEIKKSVIDHLIELIGVRDPMISYKIQRYLKQSKFQNPNEYKKLNSNLNPNILGSELIEVYPQLIDFWDESKNLPYTMKSFSYNSHAKVHWKCPKGHEIFRRIDQVTRYLVDNKSYYCKSCANKKAHENYNFKKSYPELSKEWHTSLNGKNNPEDFTEKSTFTAYFICTNNHIFQTQIRNRVKSHKKGSSGCCYCAGRKATSDRNFEKLYPIISREWHPTLNGDLKPKDIPPHGGIKYWWKCPHCNYEYKRNCDLQSRVIKRCPRCKNNNKSQL
jgi:very-short-patch-repair endonuclease